jgi:multiple sugar transport system permease protein
MSDRSMKAQPGIREGSGKGRSLGAIPARSGDAGRHRAWRRFIRRGLPKILGYVILSAVGLLYFVPLLWLIITSLKLEEQVFTLPLTWIPRPIMWRNYWEAINYPGFPFLLLLKNSLYYAVMSTLGIVLSSALAAYAMARIPFRGRQVLFGITIATLMIPGVVTMIPTYIIFRRLDWIGTYNPLIVPSWMGSAFFIFMLRQFMLGLPWELTDAARVDGASELRIFISIILPLIRPALLVVTVFNFMACWNDFFGPVIYVNEASKMPLSLGLYAFMTRSGTAWPYLMAASMIVSLPIFTIFFLAQRTFIEGIAMTGLKGA